MARGHHRFQVDIQLKVSFDLDLWDDSREAALNELSNRLAARRSVTKSAIEMHARQAIVEGNFTWATSDPEAGTPDA